MSQIWPKYGWDVDPQQVARKLDVVWRIYHEPTTTNYATFVGIDAVPDVLPPYAWVIDEHVDDDDIILQLIN